MNENSSCPAFKSILVVEDDESIRETMKFALELEGYQVFAAANGQEGLDLIASIPRPCLILLDLMMPVMNGWEFVELMGKNIALATIPVVLVTAFEDRAHGIRSEGLIKKPVNLEALYRVVRKWCESGYTGGI